MKQVVRDISLAEKENAKRRKAQEKKWESLGFRKGEPTSWDTKGNPMTYALVRINDTKEITNAENKTI